jgi:uncharacterized protein YbgA (DUF1722 family)/uncharacterized protein YbbK (DUF523 family)
MRGEFMAWLHTRELSLTGEHGQLHAFNEVEYGMTTTKSSHPRLKIAISSCLLGQRVRFDANHKHDRYITDTLGKFFDFIPICPEVAIGLGVPRPTLRLTGDASAPRAVGVTDPTLEVTERLLAFGRDRGQAISDISGYIFKSKSPSCGLWRVKVYQANGHPPHLGRGLYAAAFLEQQPLLPVEEEGRLADPALRENFIERLFAWQRWQELQREGLTAARLVEFHARHKYSLMSHGQAHYRHLGQWVADAGNRDITPLGNDYIRDFMRALGHLATPRRHANVLQHLAGYLKRDLDGSDKAELVEVIDHYRHGLIPLIVPITLLRHHFRRHPNPYIQQQIYLDPHPYELMLRNQI